MIEFNLPWIEAAILVPLVGAAWVAQLHDPDRIRRHSLVLSLIALACAVGAFVDFTLLETFEAHDHWDLLERMTGSSWLLLDELSAPLLPLTALLFALTILATLRTAVRRFSFASTLVSESIALATLASRSPWLVVSLLVVGTLPPLVDQLKKRRSVRVYATYMGLCSGLLVAGLALGRHSDHANLAVTLMAVGVLVRCGAVPFHGWVSDQFERGSFGTAILYSAPMLGVYGMMRLVVPSAPPWLLNVIAGIAVFTTAYAAAMALVQTDARRFFSFIFIGQSALVLIGLDIATPVGLTGALSVWLSVALSLTGLGLTLRCVEARTGRLSLTEYHGLYGQVPMLASFFLLTGLATIGFPGTIGFVGAELLLEGALDLSPWVGAALVSAAALNSLALLQAYFRIFTGAEPTGTINLHIRPSERVAVLVLTLLILGGGLYPQPGISSRYHAAKELISHRDQALRSVEPPTQELALPTPSPSFLHASQVGGKTPESQR